MPVGGQPGFCGVTVETDPGTRPGVVLDTLGINGARLTTPLAWDDAAWVAELSRRPPALVVVEYGTNESGDLTINPARYVANLQKLLARVHDAAPACDCLVLAPTDRADTEERTPLVRDALREAARASTCMFWDTYEVMGGKGSITAWHAETPPRAGPDGVHLHARGYRELGEKLAKEVLAGYRP
jgi:lysophospholipase L1-like esterase